MSDCVIKPPAIKHTPTALQEIAGACMIVGAVIIVPLCEIFGIVGVVGKGLKKLDMETR